MQYLKKPGFIISALGLTGLAAAFIHWCIAAGRAPLYIFSAFLSAALFAAVCLRFVPHWICFWQEREEKLSEEKRGQGTVCLGIFVFSLCFCFFTLVLAWLIKLCTGWQGSLGDSMGIWLNLDSRHYLDISRDWYLSEGDWDRLVQLVFFPAYPLAVRLFALICGNYLAAGFFVSAACFGVACVLLYKLLLLDMSSAAALRALRCLWLMPGAFFFAAPMSESMFLALSLGCIYLVRRGRWLSGCLLGALAGFTRSVGIVLLVPVLFELVHARPKGRELLKALVCMAIIPLGLAAYCLINYTVSGDAFKFMDYQSVHWGQKTGWFFNTAAYQLECAVSYWQSGNAKVALGLWCANLISCFGALVIMLFAVRKLRASYGAYFLCYFIAAIGATWLLSAPRYMTVMFPLPAALSLLSEKRGAEALLMALMSMAAFAYLCAFVLGCQVW